MTGLTITIDDGGVRDKLQSLHGRLLNLRPAMDNIGATVADASRLTFVRQADPWGAPWKPLSPATVARRRKSSAAILRDTGRLMNSISHRVTGNNRVEIGSNAIYAGTHQFGAAKGQYGRTRHGAPIPWGRVPARPFLPLRRGGGDLPAPWLTKIKRIIEVQIQEEL
jgi:phage virion morphogenesis protein